jgi:hypothetical protein
LREATVTTTCGRLARLGLDLGKERGGRKGYALEYL